MSLMKKYRVHVNGKTYDVAVEEIGEVVSAAGPALLPSVCEGPS
jgi:hypothetical protein